MAARTWDNHYASSASELLYPDENLVRLVKKSIPKLKPASSITAVDLGCGSGRHLQLLRDLGIGSILGLDSSFNALVMSKKRFSGALLLGDISRIPLKDASADVVIAWGSLHYCTKKELPAMLREIVRILTANGHLFATLRSHRDTYIKTGRHIGNNTWATALPEIKGTIVSFYNKRELTKSFSGFSACEFGLMERNLMGDINTRISHWMIHGIK